ncbi:MAG: three-Cys-motif partner protein TcmP [Verrucomicrobiota bacterium]|jgi:three-Cys-motif partner protein
MSKKDFHDKPYDAGTLAKLRIFELYTQEWIPVFLSRAEPPFNEVHLFDFFCGPGTDSRSVSGSPLRILGQLRAYYQKGLAGWNKVHIVAHLFDENQEKVALLKSILRAREWEIPGVEVDCQPLVFQDALAQHEALLSDSRAAKLLVIDQFGVDEVTEAVFSKLIRYPTTDFIFFLSSSTLHRFHDHPAIKQKIEKPEDSYDVHRAVVDYYRKLIPSDNQLFLGSFSIRKRSNIYGLIFGSHHPLGIHKFLQVAWANDEIAGEANFDIERENIHPEEGILPLELMRPSKIRGFEQKLEAALKSGQTLSEADVVRFCIEAGMTCKHSAPVLKKLKDEGVIETDFRVPDVGKLKSPRPIRLIR